MKAWQTDLFKHNQGFWIHSAIWSYSQAA